MIDFGCKWLFTHLNKEHKVISKQKKILHNMNHVSLTTYLLRYAKPSMTNEDNLISLDT